MVGGGHHDHRLPERQAVGDVGGQDADRILVSIVEAHGMVVRSPGSPSFRHTSKVRREHAPVVTQKAREGHAYPKFACPCDPYGPLTGDLGPCQQLLCTGHHA